MYSSSLWLWVYKKRFAETKRIEAFRCSATFWKIRAFHAEGEQSKHYTQDCMHCHYISMPFPKALGPNECKVLSNTLLDLIVSNWTIIFILVLPTRFDRLRFQVETGNKQTLFNINKLKTLHAGVFMSQPRFYDCFAGPSNSQSRCADKQEVLSDEVRWSLLFETFSLYDDDKQDKLFLEGHTVPCLHSDDFFQTNPEKSIYYCLISRKSGLVIWRLWVRWVQVETE